MKPAFLLLVAFTATLFSKPSSAQTQKEIIEKLSIVSMVMVDDNYIDIPADSVLRSHVKIELVTKEEFLSKKKTRTNWLVNDTIKYKKKSGVFRLPVGTRTKTYRDKITDGEDYLEYKYLGFIPFLNSYLVKTMLWEDVNYDLVSKKDGNSQGVLSSIPYISADKKKLATAYADAYDTECEIVIYKLVNGKTLNHIYVRYLNWMPGDEDLIFFGNDGKLYMPYQFSENFWGADGNYNKDYQYLRLSF